MITTYGGKREIIPIEIGFDGRSTVVVKAPGIQVGTYELKGNEIVIDFQPKFGEQITLTKIRVNGSSLEADVKFPSDSVYVVNHLVLNRQNANPNLMFGRDDRLCGRTAVAPNLRRIFEAYQMKCPINIAENREWPKVKFFEVFLAALAGEAIGAAIRTDRPDLVNEEWWHRKLDIMSSDKGIVIVTQTHWSRDQIDNALTPLMEDPQTLQVAQSISLESPGDLEWIPKLFKSFEGDGTQMAAAFQVFPASALKASLKNEGQVELNWVWAEIVNAALPLGINLDSKTETRTDKRRTIRQTAPRRIPDTEGYIYFEYVTVRMNNYRDKREDAFSVDVTSKIVKRKGFSSFTQSVDCNLVEATNPSAGKKTCSEFPYMRAIIRALTGQE